MLGDLSLLQSLLRKHGHSRDAMWLGRVVAESQGDPKALALALNSNQLWGGSGSIADQFLVPSEWESESIRRGRKEFYDCMARVAQAMLQQGVINPRAEAWAKAFNTWSKCSES